MPRAARTIPWIETNDAGVHYVHWCDAGRTKRLSLKTADPAIAQGLYSEFLAEKAAIEKRPAPREMTVGNTLSYYIDEHVANKVVDTARQDYAVLALNRHLQNDPLSSIDARRCRAYRDLRAAEGVKDATIRRELSTLRAAARFALAERRIDADAMPQLELPADTAPRADKWLTKEQFNLLHAAAEGRAQRFIWLAYWTAGRKDVVYKLTWSQVDFQRGLISLNPPGRKVTKKRNPTIGIPKALAPMLAEWRLDAEGDEEEKPDVSGKPVLGVSMHGTTGESDTLFEKAVKAAGLESLGVTPHWLRHSRASHMLQDGVPLFKVARFLGDTAVTVDRVYGHLAPGDMGDD